MDEWIGWLLKGSNDTMKTDKRVISNLGPRQPYPKPACCITTMRNLPNDIDPLTLALQPPPDETLQQKVERLRVEEEARRISHLIDEQIKVDRAQMKKAANAHKILLLGTLQQSLIRKTFDPSVPDRSGRVRQEHNPQESVYIYSA